MLSGGDSPARAAVGVRNQSLEDDKISRVQASLAILSSSKPAVSGKDDPELSAVLAAIFICQIKPVDEGDRGIAFSGVSAVEGIENRLTSFGSGASIRKSVYLLCRLQKRLSDNSNRQTGSLSSRCASLAVSHQRWNSVSLSTPISSASLSMTSENVIADVEALSVTMRDSLSSSLLRSPLVMPAAEAFDEALVEL